MEPITGIRKRLAAALQDGTPPSLLQWLTALKLERCAKHSRVSLACTHEHAPYACAHVGPQKRQGTLRPRLSCRDFHTSSACVSVARRCLRYVDDIVSQGYDELVFLKDADESDLQDVITGVGTL